MKLDDIADSSEIFIDSNIFIYHFTNSSEECSRFLKRCENFEVKGFTSVSVILEVLHRLMMVEVVKKGILAPPNLVKKLNKNPDIIKQLNDYFRNTQMIEDMEITIFPIDHNAIKISQTHRLQHGLKVNDSLISALMENENIASIATNDKAFNNIESLQVYKPSDIYD